MTTTTTAKTTLTFDFSTIKALNENFAAAREAFGWPEPLHDEYLSNYEQRATSMDIEGLPEPDPLLLGLMLYEGVAVRAGDPGSDMIGKTMTDVLYEIVDEEWRSSCPNEDDDIRCWMRDNDYFGALQQEAIGMLPDELRVDPQWDAGYGRWSATCNSWDAAIRDVIDGRDIDGFLRDAVQKALQETIEKAKATMASLAKAIKRLEQMETEMLSDQEDIRRIMESGDFQRLKDGWKGKACWYKASEDDYERFEEMAADEIAEFLPDGVYGKELGEVDELTTKIGCLGDEIQCEMLEALHNAEEEA